MKLNEEFPETVLPLVPYDPRIHDTFREHTASLNSFFSQSSNVDVVILTKKKSALIEFELSISHCSR